ncbi:hypothetical protein ATANTOWER_010243, partial [Ataeniobius toweri]|nr:hypothetical protein [Ataeniobius toweri]
MMEQRRVQQKHFCVSFYDLRLFRMSFIVVLTLLTSVCSLQVDCCPDCQEVNQTGKFNFKNMCRPLMLAPCCTLISVWTGVAEGRCPLNLISTALKEKENGYSERITLQVWMKNKDFRQSPQIEIYGEHKEVFLPVRKCKRKSECENIRCCKHPKKHYLWKLEYDFKAEARKNVSVSYISKSTNCSVYYLVP